MTADHAFAQYVRILGRGATLSRSLTEEEAERAMGLILDDAVEPIQLGALLLLLRYRGESAAELAGFVRAARGRLERPESSSCVDLDWPSYADRHKQQPYFVLAAMLLAENGVRVLMHGIEGFSEGYAPTRPVLAALGVPLDRTLDAAAARVRQSGFAYLCLEQFCPAVERLFHLRPLLGVRTAANSFARAINPMAAPAQLQGIVHPPYRGLQQEAARLLGQPRAAVFKGAGGEVQRNPFKSTRLAWVLKGETGESEWPALRPRETYSWREESLEPERVAAVWCGELSLPAAEAAVIATAALGLWITGRAGSPREADEMAAAMWAARLRKPVAAETLTA